MADHWDYLNSRDSSDDGGGTGSGNNWLGYVICFAGGILATFFIFSLIKPIGTGLDRKIAGKPDRNSTTPPPVEGIQEAIEENEGYDGAQPPISAPLQSSNILPPSGWS